VQNGLTKVGYMFFLRDDVEAGALKALRIKQQDDIVLPFLEDNRMSKGFRHEVDAIQRRGDQERTRQDPEHHPRSFQHSRATKESRVMPFIL